MVIFPGTFGQPTIWVLTYRQTPERRHLILVKRAENIFLTLCIESFKEGIFLHSNELVCLYKLDIRLNKFFLL
jgi:hypothetical protein